LCCSEANELLVDLDATFKIGTELDIPQIVEWFQDHLIDDFWLPDPLGNKLYKLDFTNTTVAGTVENENIYYANNFNIYYFLHYINIIKDNMYE
jgi:hypothetical protein